MAVDYYAILSQGLITTPAESGTDDITLEDESFVLEDEDD